MKHLTSILSASTLPLVSNAQQGFPEQISHFNMEVFKICATIFAIILVMAFTLSILKRLLEHRIKNKIVEKGIPENLAKSILQTNTREDGTIHFKWFTILTGIGVGLSIVSNFLPLGINSLAIMSFSIAASFLAFHIFLKRSRSKEAHHSSH